MHDYTTYHLTATKSVVHVHKARSVGIGCIMGFGTDAEGRHVSISARGS